MAAAISAGADEETKEEAYAFTKGICTHLAMLYVAGYARSLQEQGVSGSWSAPAPLAPVTAGHPRELNMRVALQGIVTVLTSAEEARMQAGAAALEAFVTALLTASAAQKAGLGPAALEATKEEATPMDTDGGAADDKARADEVEQSKDGQADASGRPRAGTEASNKVRPPAVPLRPPSEQAGLPRVLDDVVSSVLHACHGDTWGARMGGAHGVQLLMRRLPRAYTMPWSPQLVAALANVLAVLPEHAVAQKALVAELFELVVMTVALEDGPAPAAGDGDKAAAKMEVDSPSKLVVRLPSPAMSLSTAAPRCLFPARLLGLMGRENCRTWSRQTWLPCWSSWPWRCWPRAARRRCMRPRSPWCIACVRAQARRQRRSLATVGSSPGSRCGRSLSTRGLPSSCAPTQ